MDDDHKPQSDSKWLFHKTKLQFKIKMMSFLFQSSKSFLDLGLLGQVWSSGRRGIRRRRRQLEDVRARDVHQRQVRGRRSIEEEEDDGKVSIQRRA